MPFTKTSYICPMLFTKTSYIFVLFYLQKCPIFVLFYIQKYPIFVLFLEEKNPYFPIFPQYKWNIIESGIKHHNHPKPNIGTQALAVYSVVILYSYLYGVRFLYQGYLFL